MKGLVTRNTRVKYESISNVKVFVQATNHDADDVLLSQLTKKPFSSNCIFQCYLCNLNINLY